MPTQADLDQTASLVEALERRIVARMAGVRDLATLKAAVDEGVGELGHLDVACANGGICAVQVWDEVAPEIWQETRWTRT
jgi:NAD(P)-dependent dehydrogenase (short-subunit alcohol dehydrogenase family)